MVDGNRRTPGAGTGSARCDEGVALLLVLVFILLLSVVVVDFSYETQVEASQVSNTNAEFEAYLAAKSAVATGFAILQADWQPPVTPSGNRVGAPMGTGTYNPNDPNDPNNPNNQPPVYDARIEEWGQLTSLEQLNNAEARCIIEDESGKLNLNALLDRANNTEREAQIAVLRNLFEGYEVEEDPTDAILDWLDMDENIRELGAESSDYETLDIPYAHAGPMASIEELLLIRGITRGLYFDLNQGVTEEQPDNKSNPNDVSGNTDQEYPESLARWLPDLLTVLGNPEGKININTARRPLLEAVFYALQAPDPAGAAEAVCQRQLSEPFADLGEVSSVTGVNTDLFVIDSDWFRIQGDGRCGETMVRIEAYVQRMKRATTLDPNSKTPPPDDPTLGPTFKIWDWRVYR